jgi:tetratricopeptide (TPR) repeat protein
VAVLPVETVAEGHDESLDLLADAVRLALLDDVAAARGLAVVDPREVDAVRGTPAEVARAVAADEVLAATATARGPTTRLELRRLKGTDASLLKAASFEVPSGELGLVVDAVAGQLRTVLPRSRPDPGAVRSRADNPEDLRRFLAVRRVLAGEPTPAERESAAEELRAIRTTSPLLLEAYSLAAANGRCLYSATRARRHLEEARAAVAAGLRAAPRDRRMLAAQCELAIAAGEVDEQRRAIEELARAAPADPMVPYFRARLAQAEGRFDDARRHLEARIRLRPSWQAYVAAGRFEMQQGRMEEAERLLRTALGLDPDNRPALSVLGGSLASRDPERALPLLERLVGVAGDAESLTNLGMAYMLLGRYGEAVAPLERSRALQPGSIGPVLDLGDVHGLLGDERRARALYREALAAIEPDSNPSRDQLLAKARCLAQLGEARDAVVALDRALALPVEQDALGEVHFEAALVLALVGETNSSLVHAEKALEAGLDPVRFVLPWFDPLRHDPTFVAITSPPPSG